MLLIALFGVGLLIAVTLSGIAARTVLSTSLLFLGAGMLVGPGGLGLVDLRPDDEIILVLADLALFVVLYADGQRANLRALKSAGRLAGRALGFALPLTLLGVAAAAHYIAGLPWILALLVGAILSPTDPVFASAIVGRKDISPRLRGLLNVESGINDGLALPFVIVLIALATREDFNATHIALELVGGLALGIGAAALVAYLWKIKNLGPEPRLQPLGPLALGVLVYGVSHLAHLNPYLAAFGAGATLATLAPASSHSYEELGEMLSESAKFAALLVFGALITPSLLDAQSTGTWIVVVVAIVLVRPLAMLVSLLGAKMPRSEKLAAAWFGPKGFASVVYVLLALKEGAPQGETVFGLVAVTITASIILHSSTDVPVAKALQVPEPASLPSRGVLDDPGVTLADDESATKEPRGEP